MAYMKSDPHDGKFGDFRTGQNGDKPADPKGKTIKGDPNTPLPPEVERSNQGAGSDGNTMDKGGRRDTGSKGGY